jgi:hypothetical protein
MNVRMRRTSRIGLAVLLAVAIVAAAAVHSAAAPPEGKGNKHDEDPPADPTAFTIWIGSYPNEYGWCCVHSFCASGAIEDCGWYYDEYDYGKRKNDPSDDVHYFYLFGDHGVIDIAMVGEQWTLDETYPDYPICVMSGATFTITGGSGSYTDLRGEGTATGWADCWSVDYNLVGNVTSP